MSVKEPKDVHWYDDFKSTAGMTRMRVTYSCDKWKYLWKMKTRKRTMKKKKAKKEK